VLCTHVAKARPQTICDASSVRRGRRLLIGSGSPIVVLLTVAIMSIIGEFAQDRWKQRATFVARRGWRAAARSGLQRALPLCLVVTFVLVPSTATRIFKTWLCVPIEYDPADAQPRRYLNEDLSMNCDADDYKEARNLAFLFIFVWPVG
jgi:hypothetical protein